MPLPSREALTREALEREALEREPIALVPAGATPRAAHQAPVRGISLLRASVVARLCLVAAAVLLDLFGGPPFQIPVPSAAVVLKCLAVAIFATLGHTLIYAAVTRASAQVVAPMTYVQLLVAVGIGWSLFGDAPDLATLGGAGLIILGGLWLWRAHEVPKVARTPD